MSRPVPDFTDLPSFDLPSLLWHRFAAGDDLSTVGFYDRRARGFEVDTQRSFLDRCAGVAQTLTEAGTGNDHHVLIAASSPEALWLGFLGSVLAGSTPVLLPVRPALDSPNEIAAKLRVAWSSLPQARLLVQAGATGPCIDTNGLPWTPLLTDQARGDLFDWISQTPGDVHRPHHLQFTSGSTGSIKPVLMTHRNVVANTWGLARRMEARPEDHVVSWLPLYHDMGLIGMAMLSLTAGAHLRLLSPFDFLADPANWLQAVTESPGSITAAPNFAFDYTTRRVSESRMGGLDLSSWKKCYCGAEPVDTATIAAFLERFGPVGMRPEAMQPTYGLAEATLMATMPFTGDIPHQVSISTSSISFGGPVDIVGSGLLTESVEDPSAAVTHVVALGTPAEEMGVEIVAEDGTIVRVDDTAGEVVVSGPSITPGYLMPDGSIDRFEGGRCPTGDIGFMHDGELYLIERIKNIIIKNGQNLSAAAIERALAELCEMPLDNFAVIETSITDMGSGIAAVVEPPRKTDPSEVTSAVLRAVRDLELPIDEIVVLDRNGIPRTTSGKKQHACLRAQLRSGDLKIASRTSTLAMIGPDEVGVIDLDRVDERARVLRLVESHARRRGWVGTRIEEDHHLATDLGFDSLALIELTLDIEREFGHGVPEERLNELNTVSDILRIASDDSSAGCLLTATLQKLIDEIPQIYRRVDLQTGRQLRIDGRWITDFGSLNYLGLDLHPDVINSVAPAVKEWGVHPSWTRAVASPSPYFDLEERLAALVGAPDVMVFSTITLLHFGVLPKLATAADTLIVDHGAHNSIHEAAELTAARGAALRAFDHRHLETLEEALRDAPGRPVIALNGVYSMTGAMPDLAAIQKLASEHGALVYVDDAHGFGILGANPDLANPYGHGGGGVVRHQNLSFDNLVYVAGLSKAFSSMAAFVTCRSAEERQLFESASTSIFSGPIPVASMASALAGLQVNEREGDARRRILYRLSDLLIGGARERGYVFDNELTFPIVNLVIGDVPRVVRASQILWDRGILYTPSVFPAAPLDRGGFRVSITANNTDDEVEQLLDALDAVEAELGRPDHVPDQRLLREV